MATNAPDLLVDWEPRWRGFRTSIDAAFRPAPKRLCGEIECVPPMRSISASAAAHVALIVAILLSQAPSRSVVQLRSEPLARYKMVYFRSPLLPAVHSADGAEAGRAGRNGGQESWNPQEIRAALRPRLADTVAAAPSLSLPESATPPNLVAFGNAALPAPPLDALGLKELANSVRNPDPVEAVPPSPQLASRQLKELRAKLMVPEIVAPAPDTDRNVERLASDYKAVSAVPPVPEVTGRTDLETSRNAMTPSVIPPPADLQTRTSLPVSSAAANVLAVPPSPETSSRVHLPTSIGMVTAAVPPAPELSGTTVLKTNRAFSGAAAVPPSADAGHAQLGAILGGNLAQSRLPQAGVVSHWGNGRSGGATTASGSPSGTRSGAAGAGGAAGAVLSNNPGDRVGVPAGAGPNSMAMGPRGEFPGFGGSGGGTGVGAGRAGTGTGREGNGPGALASSNAAGRGADPAAHGGISPAPGPGGAGGSGGVAMTGVTIEGNSVTIPSFASGSGMSGSPTRGHLGSGAPAITIIATPRSGGAMNEYGRLHGPKVYTIYIDTRMGTATLQFAERSVGAVSFDNDLTSPEVLQADLPAHVSRLRTVVAFVIDRTGSIRDAHVLDSVAPAGAGELLAALRNWKFRPVLRGNAPIEVDAIIGFGISTH